MLDFWQWSGSDILGNSLRGKFAEFIVACALGLEGGVRTEWDAFDLCTLEGKRIEVKSASYIQSWHQTKLSTISFGIRTTLGWDAATNTSAITRSRQAHVYVFCLLHHQDKATVDPLDLSQWKFYVLPTQPLNERFPSQKSLSLASLLRLNPEVCEFSELRRAVEAASRPVVSALATNKGILSMALDIARYIAEKRRAFQVLTDRFSNCCSRGTRPFCVRYVSRSWKEPPEDGVSACNHFEDASELWHTFDLWQAVDAPSGV